MHVGWILCTWICKQMGSGTAGSSPAKQLCMGNTPLVISGQGKRVENKLNCSQRINPALMASGYFKGQRELSLEQGVDYEIELDLDMYEVLGKEGIRFQSKRVQLLALVH